jgi:hypothetical protein
LGSGPQSSGRGWFELGLMSLLSLTLMPSSRRICRNGAVLLVSLWIGAAS